MEVTIDAGGQSFTDSAFVTLPAAAKSARAATDLRPVPTTSLITPHLMLVGLGGVGVGILVLLLVLVGGAGRPKKSVTDRIDAFTSKGAGRSSGPAPAAQSGVAAQAVGMAEKALGTSGGLEEKLGDKLEAAGVSLKPAEWLLLHTGIAIGATAFLFLLSGADPLFTVVAFVAGVLVPWVYLGRKQSKRLKAFDSQLAPTLQLMAGSLQAGLSLAQGMDTIVREGADPMAVEFRRALVETRLGVPIEDALESIAERMHSDDFKWTVMAIRIQREVGGNLAELMLNVAGTLRERDYLRRQVKSLSAEGRFSAYILLALPPGVMLYEALTNRSYLDPLFTTGIGWLMLGAMGGMMGLGGFMMKRMIKLEI
jgi:tight adherence protein B